jgi:hypothetical protein
MNTTTRVLIAIPLAAAALSAGATPAMAETVSFPFAGVDDKDGPNPDPGPQDGPDDKDGPNNDPGPDGPDELDGPNPDDDDDDGGDNDDDGGDNDDGDNDGDDDGDDGGDNDVRRPTRVDAGIVGHDAAKGEFSLTWALATGSVITAAGGFTTRRAAQRRH